MIYTFYNFKTKEEYTEKNYLYYNPENPYDYQEIGSDISGTNYDAATVNWGEQWRMASRDEMGELFRSSKTSTEMITLNGVYGHKITSLNGNSIFIPYGGTSNTVAGAKAKGFYWLPKPYKWESCINANYFYMGEHEYNCYSKDEYPRYVGLSIRAVRKK